MHITPSLTLPDTFLAFHTLHQPHYLTYAQARLHSHDDALDVVQTTFGDLAITWLQILSSPNPAAHAWTVLTDHVQSRVARRRRHATPRLPVVPPLLCRRTRQDVDLLRGLGCSDEVISMLIGASVGTVRSLPLPGQKAGERACLSGDHLSHRCPMGSRPRPTPGVSRSREHK